VRGRGLEGIGEEHPPASAALAPRAPLLLKLEVEELVPLGVEVEEQTPLAPARDDELEARVQLGRPGAGLAPELIAESAPGREEGPGGEGLPIRIYRFD